MQPPIPDEALTAITDALLQGRKIEAVKLYRGLTKLGLKESLEEIEKLETHLRATFPEKFPTAAPRGKGCAGTTAVFVAAVAIAATWWIGR